jgi:hypothetical protein
VREAGFKTPRFETCFEGIRRYWGPRAPDLALTWEPSVPSQPGNAGISDHLLKSVLPKPAHHNSISPRRIPMQRQPMPRPGLHIHIHSARSRINTPQHLRIPPGLTISPANREIKLCLHKQQRPLEIRRWAQRQRGYGRVLPNGNGLLDAVCVGERSGVEGRLEEDGVHVGRGALDDVAGSSVCEFHRVVGPREFHAEACELYVGGVGVGDVACEDCGVGEVAVAR